MYNKVFISYAIEDFEYANQLYDYLRYNGFLPWMDKKSLLPGQSWEFHIQEQLRKADFIILLLSETSIAKRGYVQKEFNQALIYCEEKLDPDIYIIPIKINSCEVPTKLSKFQWIEYSSKDSFAKIRESLNSQRNLLVKEYKRRNASSSGFGYQIKKVEEEYGDESPKQIIEIQYPIFNDLKNESLKEFNTIIEHRILNFSMHDSNHYFNYLPRLQKMDASGEGMGLFKVDSTSFVELSYQLLHPNFISYTAFYSFYNSGAAHGNYGTSGYSYFLNPLRDFKLQEQFKNFHSSLPALREIIHSKLMKKAKEEFQMEDPSQFYVYPEGLTADKKNFSNFYFRNTAIVFVYNPYHLTAWSYGAHHIEITFDELLDAFPEEKKLNDFISHLKASN